MRKYLTSILLTIVLSIFSCESNKNDQEYPFEAEVLGKNFDCGEYEVKFSNNLDQVINLFGKSVIDSVYIAGNLPDNLKMPGLKIVVKIENPSTHELTACTTMGPSLNWVWITAAKPK
jgi:hypothetical protein